MDTAVYTEVAKRMEKSLTVNHFAFKIEDKFLFKTLYSAFCRHNPNFHMPALDTIETDTAFYDAIDEMYAWYKRTYENTFGSISGKPGQQRTVTDNNVYDDEEYGFDTVYGKVTFRKSLADPPKQNQDFRAFILHAAVAFCTTPTELDELLKFYTFHRLHAKNIHDLSIYAALSALPFGPIDSKINPFDEVEKLYEEARAIVKDVRKSPNSERTAAALPTAFIRDSLMGDVVLSHERFIQFVNDNKEAFNMRHSLLLQEYRKLSELFRYIFDNHYFKGADDCWYDSVEAYSWYSFVTSFSIDYSNPSKRFSEQFNRIDKDNKHPTRESMIILWLYAYTFISAHGVTLTEKMFDRICKSLATRQAHVGDTITSWADEAKRCYYRYDQITNVFNVRKFLFQTSEAPAAYFSGGELLAWLNERLQQFDLGSLNANTKFDATILQLCKVKMSLDEQDRSNYLIQNAHGLWYDGTSMLDTGVKISGVENVPYALVAIVEVLQNLKEGNKTSLPLECKLYE